MSRTHSIRPESSSARTQPAKHSPGQPSPRPLEPPRKRPWLLALATALLLAWAAFLAAMAWRG